MLISIDFRLALSIPSTNVLSIVNDLIQYGEVRRGWLGFSIDRKVLRTNNLLQISYIHPGGPGEEAMLKKGDIIDILIVYTR